MNIITTEPTPDHTPGHTAGLSPQTVAAPGSTAASFDSPTHSGRARWPLFGVVAGAAGLGGGLASIQSGISEQDAQLGAGVIDQLDRGPYHVTFVLGILTVVSLLVSAAAWRRWVDDRGLRQLGARVIGAGMTATAGVHLIGTSAAGSMALYMPGGPDEGWMSRDGLFVSYTLLDFGMILSWWGVLAGALGVAAISLGRRRVLPRWMGVVSVVFVLPPIAMGVGMALPGLPGLVMPLWLTIISVGMIFSRTARA